MSSSMRLPVSINAVATMVSEPASSVLRAAAKILRGISIARASMPPFMVRPPPPIALLNARAVRVIESSRINTCFPASTSPSPRSQALIFRRLLPVDREQLGQLRTAIAAARLAVNPHAVPQTKTADDFGRYKNILWCLHEVALRVAQESKTFARNFNDAFAKFRFPLNLLAVFNGTLAFRSA